MKILSLFYSSYITRNLLDIQYQSIQRYLQLPANEPCDRLIIHSTQEEIQKKQYLIQPDVSQKERLKPSNWIANIDKYVDEHINGDGAKDKEIVKGFCKDNNIAYFGLGNTRYSKFIEFATNIILTNPDKYLIFVPDVVLLEPLYLKNYSSVYSVIPQKIPKFEQKIEYPSSCLLYLDITEHFAMRETANLVTSLLYIQDKYYEINQQPFYPSTEWEE